MNSKYVSEESLIADQVMRWAYLAERETDLNMLRRAVTVDEAIMAWRRIIELENRIGSKHGLLNVASSIGREVVCADLQERQLRTQQDIRKAAAEAASHASALLRLIEENASLECMGEDLLPSLHRAAITRIQRGVINLGAKSANADGRWFDAEREAELDELQSRDFPEIDKLTTSQAYRLINHEELNSLGGLKARLKGFIEIAKQSAETSPPVSRPKKESARGHALALQICHILNSEYGSPNHDISAGLVSAVFESVVDSEVVKKWWQRDAS